MPSLFAHMSKEELANHPAIIATAEFLVRAIHDGRLQRIIEAQQQARETAKPRPSRKKAA